MVYIRITQKRISHSHLLTEAAPNTSEKADAPGLAINRNRKFDDALDGTGGALEYFLGGYVPPGTPN